ncbi:hypothetical protein [Niallia endozanthoxylica]|uniref:Uncharacterized protein n=1 Tax=Niallia endozanthoxylica TaxID=2036016 RepID=A0A5J5H2V7_9BACI|nr:hypothetical protein [Niallia endozanthoxylica]KAA9014906.1 hypothetical protein F4V44_23180 [Niallia endozanthoxylica]
MFAIIGVLLIGAIISFFEISPLVKKKWWREIVVYFLLLTTGLTLSILIIKDVAILNPIDLLIKIYSPVASFMERILT